MEGDEQVVAYLVRPDNCSDLMGGGPHKIDCFEFFFGGWGGEGGKRCVPVKIIFGHEQGHEQVRGSSPYK